MAATWRLMVCPTEATDCSASLSGSASLHRDLGHGRGHEAKLLRAPDEQREEPEDDDRNEDGDGGGERRGAAEQARHAGRGDLRRDQPESEEAADEEPGDRGGQRHQEGRARRSLLEREDQPADRGDVVIGGGGETALRRRAGRTPRADELPRGGGPRLGGCGASANSSGGFLALPRAAWRLGRLLALARRSRRRSSRLRCSALSRSAREVRLGRSRPRSRVGHRPAFRLVAGSLLREGFALGPWPPLPQFQTSLALAP